MSSTGTFKITLTILFDGTGMKCVRYIDIDLNQIQNIQDFYKQIRTKFPELSQDFTMLYSGCDLMDFFPQDVLNSPSIAKELKRCRKLIVLSNP